MALPKIRNLGQYGVIADIDAYDLPPTAFSFAKNVRFRNNRVSQAPAYKIIERLTTTDPRFVVSVQETSGQDLLFTGYTSGRVYRAQNGAETDVSISGYTTSVAEGTWSSAYLANILYVNRQDRAPWMFTSSGSTFVPMANWPSGWTCNLLRAQGGALWAFGVTQAGVSNPTMVCTSSFAAPNSEPQYWLPFVSGVVTNATQNILSEMQGPIMDAQPLGNDMIVYGLNQCWRFTADFSGLIWDNFKLPFQKGALSANCSVEINSKHYVFGPTDIWTHDGVTEQSICDQRVRDLIYGSINMSSSNRCYVYHNPQLFEIHFCYVSVDAFTAFSGNIPDGCNRAAIYNYKSDTWVFGDLPVTYMATQANTSSSQTYASTSLTYATAAGSYLSYADASKRCTVMVGNTTTGLATGQNLTATLYAYDMFGANSITGFPVDSVVMTAVYPYLERQGIDLDEAFDLEGYKQFNYLVPQGRIDLSSTATIDFAVGSSNSYIEEASFDPWMGYDGEANYKIDMNEAGKYLAIKIRFLDYKPFTLSGYDINLQETGQKN